MNETDPIPQAYIEKSQLSPLFIQKGIPKSVKEIDSRRCSKSTSLVP